ncbi:MAG: helix-turn-helix domain-containing protein [bacterium]|nr:helix-turn-helix domain-containing protein [bacterium]
MAKSYRTVAAVRTSYLVVDFLSRQGGPVTHTAVQDGLGIPEGTVLSHLATLSEIGVVKEEHGLWSPGIKLALYHQRYKTRKEVELGRIEAELRMLAN